MVRATLQRRQRQQLCGTSARAWPHDDPRRRLRDRHLRRPEHDPDQVEQRSATLAYLRSFPRKREGDSHSKCNTWEKVSAGDLKSRHFRWVLL